MKKKIIKKSFITDGDINFLQGLHIEVEALINFLQFAISDDNYSYSKEGLLEVEKLYLETAYKFEILKEEIAKKYKPEDEYSFWDIDYKKKEIVYYE